ncbi:Uncharacterized protein PHSC3_000225 [Chlamydiales bacterium STE3]|nr:Uncharacterized protein PHSC3_000225 [Chlamydiales bacterium STE3]
MRKFTCQTLSLLCCFLPIFSGTLSAEEKNEDHLEHIQPGTRALSHVEMVKIQEERAEQDKESRENPQKFAQKDEGEPKTGLVQDPLNAKFNVSANFLTPQASVGYTTHSGAFHFPAEISYLGDTIKLEDGSIWTVASSDTTIVLNWLRQQDQNLAVGGASLSLVITPNHSWFSTYMFRMTEQSTGTSVKVNMYLGPIYNGLYTHWIVAINYYTQEICLEDGSVWRLSGLDAGIFNKWLLNDTVIIGVNDGFLSTSKPNILINVNTLTYSRAKCIF